MVRLADIPGVAVVSQERAPSPSVVEKNAGKTSCTPASSSW
jgi:hypothetical protein